MIVKTPFLAPSWPPETGRVEKLETVAVRLGRDLARGLGRCRRMIDEDAAPLHAREGAIGTIDDLAQVVVAADAGENDLGAERGSLWRIGAVTRVDQIPGVDPGAGAVVDRDVVAGLGEMPGHWKAHVAQPDKRDFLHLVPSS